MFEVGDRVRLSDKKETWEDYKNNPKYYPKPGTTGTIFSTPEISCVFVHWDDDETATDHVWCASIEDLILEKKGKGATT